MVNTSTQIQILNMIVFQHKHRKIDSIFFKKFNIEASMLQLSFDGLNTKFEKL
jgi:hypothetical protein